MSGKLSEQQRKKYLKRLTSRRRLRRLFPRGTKKEFARWFIGRVITRLEARDRPGAEPPTGSEIVALLRAAKSIAIRDERRRRRLRADQVPAFNRRWYTDNKSWVRKIRQQVVYGLLGAHPHFFTADEGYRNFIIERRYRTVFRMRRYVNRWKVVNGIGYVFYRSHCDRVRRKEREAEIRRRMAADPNLDIDEARQQVPEPDRARWHMNVDTAGIWQYANHEIEGHPKHPFILTPAFRTRPAEAVEKIFIRHRTCDANVLDCAFCVSSVLIDSLLVAKDRAKLLRSGIDRQTASPRFSAAFKKENYLAIDHPENTWVHYSEDAKLFYNERDRIPPYHIITDRDERSLFEYQSIKASQFQVGDHIYLYNHPMYLTFFPAGAWRGEHSLVWSLNSNTRESLEFEGHGMSGKGVKGKRLAQLYASHFDDLNTLIAMVMGVTRNHLEYLRKHQADSAHGVEVEHDEPEPGKIRYVYKVGSRHARFRYRDYNRKSKKRRRSSRHFVVIQHAGKDKFEIESLHTDADGRPARSIVFPTLKDHQRVTVERRPRQGQAQSGDLAHWGIEYIDKSETQRPKKDFLYLADYYVRRRRAIGSMIKVEDIVDYSFFRRHSDRQSNDDNDDGNKDVEATVTRPKAPNNAAYIDHLRRVGAF